MQSPLNAPPAGPLTPQGIVAPLAEVATRLLAAADCAFCSVPVTSAAFVGAHRCAAMFIAATCDRCKAAGADEAEALLRRLTGRLS